MRSSFSRSVLQPSVSFLAWAMTSGWSESMKGVGPRHWRGSSAFMGLLPAGSSERVAQGGQDLAAAQFERVTRRDVGNGEQEVSHPRLRVPADARDALIGRAGHVAVGGNDGEAILYGGGARSIAI